MITKIKSVKIQFDKLLGETQKAYLFRIGNKEFWMPKSMCRNFILNKKLGGNCSIPSFKYEEIFECKIEDMDQSDIDATETIEHHIPERILPIEDRSIQELNR